VILIGLLYPLFFGIGKIQLGRSRAIASIFFNTESAERTELLGVQTTFLLKSEIKHKKE